MNLVKSVFIGLLIPALAISSIIIINHVINHGFDKLSIGALLVNLPFLLLFIQILIFKNLARTSKNLTIILFSTILGILIASTSILEEALNHEVVLLSAIILLNSLLFFSYIFWYSKLSRNTTTDLKVGSLLPSFSLFNFDEEIETADLIGKPSVFMFYRGNWCPFCVAQVKELVDAYKKAIHSGVQFIVVSPQPDENSEALAKKFDVPFQFLRDKNHMAAKSLGIFHEKGLPAGLQVLGYESDTVFPTIIMTDNKGVVTYLNLTDNYRVRPEASEFLKILQP